jgi:hypothetical protein
MFGFNVQSRLLISFFPILVLAILSEKAAFCAPQDAPDATLAQSLVDTTGTVVTADLDGDYHLDRATGHSSISGYTIEVDLTSRVATTLLRGASDGLGIRIFACDIDHDDDLDLIVTDAISLFPIAVWLNDGKGHFAQGNPWLCFALLLDNPLHYSPQSDRTNPNNPLLQSRYSINGLSRASVEVRLESAGLLYRGSLAATPQIATHRLQSRSPPVFGSLMIELTL